MTFAERLFAVIKRFLGDHKKKIIGLALLGLVAYYIKRKMTLEHLIKVVEKVMNFAQYLPLPDAPVYRPVLPIPSFEPATYGGLKTFINIQDIKARIKNKEVHQWDRLKLNVLSGFVFSVSFFDLAEVLNVVEAKYIEEFKSLDSDAPYQRAIAIIEENFRDNLSIYFEYVQNTLRSSIEEIDITKEYSKDEIYELLKGLVDRLFQDLDHANNRKKSRKNRSLVSQETQRLFYTHLERSNQRPTRFRRVWNRLTSLFSIETAERDCETSSDRFRCVRQLVALEFSLGNRLAMLFDLNSRAQELFDLVFRQFQDLVESINFHSLVYYHAQYQTNRFINRLEMCMLDRKQDKIKLASCLSLIYKIIIEEYLPEGSWSHNREFLSNEIKEAFKMLHIAREQPEEGADLDCKRNNLILTELQAERRIDFAKNEFLLKYYHERSGIDAMKDPEAGMDFETKELLAFMSKNKE